MAPEGIAKAALITSFGLFEYLWMHFGHDLCGITINPDNYNFIQTEIHFFGNLFDERCIHLCLRRSNLLWIIPFHNQSKAFADVLVWLANSTDLSLIVLKSCIFSPICSSVVQSILLWHPQLTRGSPPWNNIYLTRLGWATSSLQMTYR